MPKNIVVKIGDATASKGVVLFESQSDFQKFFTPQKIEILATIKRATPNSIYELATLTERTFPAVLKDVKSLAEYGFIALKENNDSRKSICPKLAYNYEQIVVDIPNRGFSISLQ